MLSKAGYLGLQSAVTSNVWRSLVPRWRGIASGTSGKNGDDLVPPSSDKKADDVEKDEEDEFGMDNFLVHEEEEEEIVPIEDTMKQIEDKEVTPEIANDLVNRMVDATARSLERRVSIHGNVLPAITPLSISVLRASRILTNTVHASGTNMMKYPIEKRVTAELHIDQLDLSAPAREALFILAKGRIQYHGRWVKLSFDRFPSKEENRAHIVTKMHRLVCAAKNAVGDEVDLTPLKTWDEVVEEVERQAIEDIEEAGSIERVLGQAKN